ncbi:MAG: hypothetical protein EA412_01585 [Chitinophagaceae bacterium]|nr:MAG: hypothetical protein EA412_01585 [Chitinophagaceae bacterium]
MKSQLNDIPAETENKKLEELFLAVYFNDLEKVIEFKNQYPEQYAQKEKFQIDENTTFDLTNLTFFNQTIWFDGDWIDDIKPLVEKHRQRTENMLDFWRAELGRQEIYRQIEYNYYCDFFYCYDLNDPENNEVVILDPITYFTERGFREIDLRLYKSVECFDFVEVEKLLKQGAKTNIHFYEDGDSSVISLISGEVSFLASCQVIPEFKIFETKGYNQNFDIAQMFGDILGLAAYEEMYHLLNKYGKEE